ncbi:MAG: hypothetical protein DRJ56_03390 [Thermoprotei archaeon]|nr:MAG: hypothetical protein DRJ56_03390 [Thermoprotei archaeon]
MAGMMEYEGIQLQLVEAPAIVEGSADGARLGGVALAMARNADALMIVIDATYDPAYQLRVVEGELGKTGVLIRRPKCLVTVERRGEGGVTVVGELDGCTYRDVVELLSSYGLRHALVRIEGRATLDDIEEAIHGAKVYKPAVVVVNKVELGGQGAVEEVRGVASDLPVLAFGAERFAEELGRTLVRALGLIRVYTRDPSTKEVAKRPIVLRRGATVADVARLVHSQLLEGFKYARVWRKSFRVSPQRVGRDFVLEDGDVVEIIAR